MNENENPLISLENLALYHQLSNDELETVLGTLTDLINERFDGLDLVLDYILNGAVDVDDKEYQEVNYDKSFINRVLFGKYC